MRYKAIIAYDGTDFHGWLIQPNKRTVIGVLHQTFANVFHQPCTISGASRTDAGVHALGQVAIIDTDLGLDAHALQDALNGSLPSSVYIRSVHVVAQDFHPRVAVAHKIYYYHFFTQQPLPFIARYGLHVRRELSIDILRQALQIFVGTHDFRAFCTDSDGKNTTRTIDAISIEYLKRYNVYQIRVHGKSFLHHMVRRIVGAALDCATLSKQVSYDDVRAVLEKKDPNHTLMNAPAHGLMLYKIVYT